MRRVAYVSAVIEPSIGTLNKIDGQARSCTEAGIPIDFFWMGRGTALQPGDFPNLRLVKLDGRNAVRIRLQQIDQIHNLLERYHAIVLRYTWWDPVLHARLRNKQRIILEMHTDNVRQLRSERSWRYLPEAFSSSWLRRFGGIVGVTPEIVAAEVARSAFEGKTTFIPNSIDVSSFPAPPGPLVRPGEPLRLVMVASLFYAWHGLEEILAAMTASQGPAPFELHLAGSLTDRQLRLASQAAGVFVHGVLDQSGLKELYAHVHGGVASFNLSSKGLRTATPLKTREYLAYGLPVIAGYHDAALPRDFPFQLVLGHFDIVAIENWLTSIGPASRQQIQESAGPYIDHLPAARALFDFCMQD